MSAPDELRPQVPSSDEQGAVEPAETAQVLPARVDTSDRRPHRVALLARGANDGLADSTDAAKPAPHHAGVRRANVLSMAVSARS
jgi:hypothetical protein